MTQPETHIERLDQRNVHKPVSRREFLTTSAMAFAGGVLYACTGGDQRSARVSATPSATAAATDTQWPIKRVIYLMLENRSFDNIFGRYPSANGVTSGVDLGREVPLIDCPQWLPGDIPHDHAAARNCLNDGRMDGFGGGAYGWLYGYSQFDRSDLPNYWEWADDYVLSDNFFASAFGPSYPNHMYFVAGTAAGVIDNPENILVRREGDKAIKSWGCDAFGEDVYVFAMDERGNLSKHDTCFPNPTVPEQLSQAGVDWAYYAPNPEQSGYIWSALSAFEGVFHTDLWHKGVRPVDQFVRDIQDDRLPSVSWVVPRFELSDHPPWNSRYSMNWVTDIVNAAMASPGWEHTAIFVTWDEWGGFYDHVEPPMADPHTRLGFRVPLLTISPWAHKGKVDSEQAEFTSPLRFISDNWGIDPLTPRIAQTTNLEHLFDFRGRPRKDARPLRKVQADGKAFQFPPDFKGWPDCVNPAPEFLEDPPDPALPPADCPPSL
ncbi:MAG: alkaline phosphatase family protein [Actinomycetota bacterium]